MKTTTNNKMMMSLVSVCIKVLFLINNKKMSSSGNDQIYLKCFTASWGGGWVVALVGLFVSKQGSGELMVRTVICEKNP